MRLVQGRAVLPMFSCTSETCAQAEQRKAPQKNKNAPHFCDAFGAENETRTISCNILIINNLQETEKTLGETFVAFQDVWGKRRQKTWKECVVS